MAASNLPQEIKRHAVIVVLAASHSVIASWMWPGGHGVATVMPTNFKMSDMIFYVVRFHLLTSMHWRRWRSLHDVDRCSGQAGLLATWSKCLKSLWSRFFMIKVISKLWPLIRILWTYSAETASRIVTICVQRGLRVDINEKDQIWAVSHCRVLEDDFTK